MHLRVSSWPCARCVCSLLSPCNLHGCEKQERARQELPVTPPFLKCFTPGQNYTKVFPIIASHFIFTTPQEKSKGHLHVTDQETAARGVRKVCLTPKPLLLNPAPSRPYTDFPRISTSSCLLHMYMTEISLYFCDICHFMYDYGRV